MSSEKVTRILWAFLLKIIDPPSDHTNILRMKLVATALTGYACRESMPKSLPVARSADDIPQRERLIAPASARPTYSRRSRMAMRSRKPCAVPGCPALTSSRWCAVHAKQPAISRPYDERRGSTAERGYGTDWRRLREVALRRDFHLCQRCLETKNRPTPATEVHHIVGIDIAPELRLDIDNTLSLCGPCHKLITAQEQGIWGRKPTKKKA
jgi:5-methylcytosine-specific restriction protein A